MTMRELLQKLFGTDNLDEEVKLDVDDKSTDGEKPKDDKTNNDKKETTTQQPNNPENLEVKEVKDMPIFDIGWFDAETGKIDLTKIKNDEVRSAIETLNKRHTQAMDARDIEDDLMSEINSRQWTVSTQMVRKMLDISGVYKDEKGVVRGSKQAVDNLAKSEPGLPKVAKKETTPLDEGFNPVEKKVTGLAGITSTAQALAALDAEG